MRVISTVMTPTRSAVERGNAQPTTELHEAGASLARGDLSALERIWDLCANELFGLALWRTGSRTDAEDVVQEVFVRLARFPQKLRKANNPGSYLRRMTHNAAVDCVKKRRPTDQIEQEAAYAAVQPAGEQRIAGEQANKLLAQLPRKQREVVYLRHYVELSFREIGDACGISLFTAANRYRTAIRQLRRLMGAREVAR